MILILFNISFTLSAQNVNDDLYYVPSSKKTVMVKDRSSVPSSIIVKNSTVKSDDVDAYNRHQTGIKKQDNELDGEWITRFNGSNSDYEYATRIIRFHNPQFAISISSPLYWDIIYGMNFLDWNIYVDGLYAYAFPRFHNPLWTYWHWNVYRPLWYNTYWYNSYWYNSYYPWYTSWYYPWYYRTYSFGYTYYTYGWHHHSYWHAPYSYNYRRNNLYIGTTRRQVENVTTRPRDNNNRTGGRIVNSNTMNDRLVNTQSSRTSRRIDTNTNNTTVRRSTSNNNSSNGTTINRTYNNSSSHMNSRTNSGNSSINNRSGNTNTRNYGGSSTRSYTSGGSIGSSGASTRSSSQSSSSSGARRR